MDALLETGQFWLRRGVDGFRLDAIDFLLHDRALRDNPAAPTPAVVPAKLFGMQVHANDMLQPEATGLLARIRGLMDGYPGTVTLGEISSQPNAFGRVTGCTKGLNGLHMAYTLQPLRGGFDWETVCRLVRDAARPDGWICWSFSNHDVVRAVSRWGPAQGATAFARLLMALLLSLRGSVCLYQGEELGLTDAVLAEHELRDPFGIAYWPEFRGRDGSRTPIPWSGATAHAGFTKGVPWLPVPAAHRVMAVDVQEADGGSLLWAFRRFLAWRREIPALMSGTLEPLPLPEPMVAFVRANGGQRVLAVFNLSDRTVRLPVDNLGDAVDGSGWKPGQEGVLEPFGWYLGLLKETEIPVTV